MMCHRGEAQKSARALALAIGLMIMGFVVASCGGEALPAATPSTTTSSTFDATSTASSTATPVPTPTPTPTSVPTPAADARVSVVVNAGSEGTPIDRRLFGTNLPAWIGPDMLADPEFHLATIESGTTLIRMPGGSWSNGYDWLGCERGDEETCKWTWAARPTDFIDFLQATSLKGMWTLSVNATAQESAAAVAFFNGSVNDTTEIGVDRLGVDWGQVGDWAQLRATNGNPEPIGMQLWEVGNEVYGSKPSSGGAQCATFGWEDVWTCDGKEYAEGTSEYDGALAHRSAMLAVDPTVEVGLVGVAGPNTWNFWGAEVIEAADEALDMYVVHHYPFNRSPSPEEALENPGETWYTVIDDSRVDLPEDTTLAITEFNLVAFENGDTDQTMTRAMNAFYLADSLGELAVGEVEIATWWNLANGVTGIGTDYGLIGADEDNRNDRAPAFYAMAMWARTGTTLLTTKRTDELRVYPTQHANGDLTIIAINISEDAVATTLTIDGLNDAIDYQATMESLIATDLNDREITQVPPANLTSPQQPIDLDFSPHSITLIEVKSTP